jgi:hypothetical protein
VIPHPDHDHNHDRDLYRDLDLRPDPEVAEAVGNHYSVLDPAAAHRLAH